MMKHKFSRSILGDLNTHGIRYGHKMVLLLNPGTVIGEHYLPWILNVLNGSRAEPPPHPYVGKAKP